MIFVEIPTSGLTSIKTPVASRSSPSTAFNEILILFDLVAREEPSATEAVDKECFVSLVLDTTTYGYNVFGMSCHCGLLMSHVSLAACLYPYDVLVWYDCRILLFSFLEMLCQNQ